MNTKSSIFDDSTAQWIREQHAPSVRLKYKLTQSNLAKHLGAGPLRVLDAGGGNGLDSIPLAEQGHIVDIIDYSSEMLAEATKLIAQSDVGSRVALHRGELGEVLRIFAGREFDLVLCHNVVGYVADAPTLLRDLATLLRAGGLMSVVGTNRYSIPYHAAFLRGDLADALAKLDARSTKAYIFDTTFAAFSAEEMCAMLRDAGCAIEGDYGIRCMCDYWGDTERMSQPEVFENIERLELALASKHPYKLLARYYQVIARRI